MDLLRKLYEYIQNQLRQAAAAPHSQYNEGYIDAIEDVAEAAEMIAWEEGEQLDD